MVVNITTVNIRGMRDENKRRAIFNRYRKGCDILCLQETHSTQQEENLWANEWGGRALLSHGSSRARGVAILFKKSFSGDISQVYCDPEGRFITCNILTENTYFCLTAVYGPNDDKPNFYTNMFERSTTYAANKIIVGDFNVCLNPRLDKKGEHTIRTKDAVQIETLLDQFHMTDLWRIRNPDVKRFSWFKPHHIETASRLDMALISQGISQQIHDIFYFSNTFSDHSALSVIYEPVQSQRGKSYWKMNTLHLINSKYVSMMNQHIADCLEETTNLSPKARWEDLKESVKKVTINFSKKAASEKRERMAQLYEVITETEDSYDTITLENYNELQQLKSELESLTTENIKSTIFRSRCQWYEEGERNNKYFFSLEKSRYNAKTCTALIHPETRALITDDNEVLKLQQNFYQDLYTTDPTVCFQIKDSPPYCVTDEDREYQNTAFGINEIAEAVKLMKNNKCPGPDGIPVDFYKIFWAQIKQVFFAAITACFNEESLHKSASRGVLSLIPKGQKDTRFLKNMRPLTMLNTDYKIIEKSLTNRIMPALDKIVNMDQTGFMPGRSILCNIRKIFDLCKIAHAEDIPVTLLQLDIAKAFDKVEMTAIQGALTYFRFADYIKDWFRILYQNFYVRVQNNGNLSDLIHIQRSVHQGAPGSAALFVCIAEVLAIIVRGDENVKGVWIDEFMHLLNQYADDTDMSLDGEDEQTINQVIKDLEYFHKQTGCAVNYDKTTAY